MTMAHSILPTELHEALLKQVPLRLIDVRQPAEHAFCSLPNSVLIPLPELEDSMDQLNPWRNEQFVVYCHHGIRSLQAISQLRSHGFTRLTNLAGGIDRWSREVDSTVPRYQ